MLVLKESSVVANKAAALLGKGNVIICPTDTVYGFLADASNKKAVDKIYKIKNRPRSKPLPVFVKDLKMAQELVEIDEKQAKILRKFWPGKHTFILKRKPANVGRPRTIIYGVDKKTIAIRIPKHLFLRKILQKINRPLAQTSVNVSGQPVVDSLSDIVNKFGKTDILVIDDGNLKKSEPSKIIDLTSKKTVQLR